MKIRIVGTVIILAIVAVFWLADDARAEGWSGGCNATVYVTPDAESSYGDDIRTSLGIVSQISGVQFRQVDGPADLTYGTGDVTWIGANVLGTYNSWTRIITLRPSFLPQFDGQLPRMQANAHLRLVLHETLHWLGLGHSPSPHEVMYPTVIDDAPRLGDMDRYYAAAVGIANGCRA